MNPQEKARTQQELDKEQQKQTEGGGILGGDGMSNISTVAGGNLSTSHTNEDGETESSSTGGWLGSSTEAINED